MYSPRNMSHQIEKKKYQKKSENWTVPAVTNKAPCYIRASGKAGNRNPESGIGTGIGTGTGTGTGIGTGMGRETYIKAGTTFTLI